MSNQIFNTRPVEDDRGFAANEGGFILVTTMLIMVLLVLLGLAVTSSTIMELQVAANDRDYKRNFYRAEGAAMETAQLLENEEDTEELRPALTSKRWLQLPNVNFRILDWSGLTGQSQVASLDNATNDVRQAAVALGVVKGNKGGSLNMAGSTVREYHLFGRSEERAGRVIIEMGYKKRF